MIYIFILIGILLVILLSIRGAVINTFHIEEDRVITKKSINGKVLSYSITYFIVKYTWLHKYYIWFSTYDLLRHSSSVQVSLRKHKEGTGFSTKEEAQEILDDVKKNPDRYYIL